MIDAAALLAVYDAQLRTDSETAGARVVRRLGPLHCAVFPGGHGFVTYGHPSHAEAAAIPSLVPCALAIFEDEAASSIEWKTRAHDDIPGLENALFAAGFSAEDEESVMLGPAEGLLGAPIPDGVVLERVSGREAILEALSTADRLFGREPDLDRAGQVLDDIERARARGVPGPQVHVARVAGRIVSCGRLEPVEGSDCAGLWGGVTDPEFRGRGIYRALTAARARAALAMGKRYLHSDSTPMSRPILERSGLIAVTRSTPYVLEVAR